jgi:hypothetical protein
LRLREQPQLPGGGFIFMEIREIRGDLLHLLLAEGRIHGAGPKHRLSCQLTATFGQLAILDADSPLRIRHQLPMAAALHHLRDGGRPAPPA